MIHLTKAVEIRKGFTFVDGVTEGVEFFARRAVLPWDAGQPNDNPAIQSCVA